jgi:tellurite resistance protein
MVSHENLSGRHLIVTFTCPRTRTNVQARYSLPDRANLGTAIANQATSTLWYEMRRSANSLLAAALGHGVAGRIAQNTMNTAMSGTGPTTGPRSVSPAERDQALVEAFRSVQSQFVWTGNDWMHQAAAQQQKSPLERSLTERPLSAYDKQVLARMCIEVAAAAGGISAEEQSQIEDALDPSVGSLQLLAKRPPLSRAELQETTPKARVPLLALATAVAYCDERLDPQEQRRLEQFAEGLALSPADRAAAREQACAWVMDQYFERAFQWGGHDEHLRENAVQMGARIGMTRDEVETAEARFQRRRAG